MILWVLGIYLIIGSWVVIFRHWQNGILLLLAYLPFAGAVTLSMYPDPLPILFKDFYFVIPAYLAFFLTRRHETLQVPANIRIAMLALAAMVFIQSFNPAIPNWMVAAIGAKVWLFYLPLFYLAFAMVESADDLIRPLRLMVVIAWIPCIIGIVQWLASMAFGYEETMTAFYGEAAERATQRFASFDVGGTFFRIPSTFTFGAQYFGYTLAMLVPAYALMKMDASTSWRRFAFATLVLVILASFMSGARAAYLFVPLLLGLIYLLEGKIFGAVKIAIMLPLASLIAMAIAGIDPIKMFDLVQGLFVRYSEEVVKQGLWDAITSSPLGTGTGMNTGPARYAVDDPDAFLGIENYYAKAVVELGLLGLAIVAGLFLILAARGYSIHKQMRDAGLRSCSAAFLAFVITIALNSFKGWQIDLDPVNIYFWVFAGFLLKLPFLDARVQELGAASRNAARELREPAARMPRPT